MKVYQNHGNITQNMHGESKSYRYVWDVSVLKSWKGVDQFNLYLASGLGMSQDKIPKETKCETFVDWVLN